jgi:hypothetical protein
MYADFVRFVPSDIGLPSLSHDESNRVTDDPSSHGEMVVGEGVSDRKKTTVCLVVLGSTHAAR